MGIWFMMLGFNLLIPVIMLGAGKLMQGQKAGLFETSQLFDIRFPSK